MSYTRALGVVALTAMDLPEYDGDPMDGSTPSEWAGVDPIYLLPTVVDTSGSGGGGGGGGAVVPYIAPLTLDTTQVPQTLPDLSTTAPAPAGVPWGILLALVGLYALSQGGGGRSGRSWGD